MGRLTKRVVDAAKPGERDLFLWCGDLPGFGLRVYPTGAKVYLAQWKRDSRTRRLVFGRHGPMTTEEARKAALTALAEVQRGHDPAAERDARKRDLTVAELAELWLAEGCPDKKASTLAMDRSRLAAHVQPLIGRVKVSALTRADVERFARDVTAGRTAREERAGPRGRRIVAGGAGVAARTLGMLGAMLEFAVARGMRPDNPVRKVKRAASPERDRLLSPVELARLGEALATAEAQGMAWQAVAAVRLLTLTGCRRDEVLRLRWEHVDLAAGRLLLDDTKTGRSVRPLATPALALLAELSERSSGSPWVLPSSRSTGPYIGLQKQWAKIRQRAGLDGVRLHDLRHNVASTAVAGRGQPVHRRQDARAQEGQINRTLRTSRRRSGARGRRSRSQPDRGRADGRLGRWGGAARQDTPPCPEACMTGVPSREAPGCPEWARQWSPRTKDGARALALYNEATVDRIADALPGLAEGVDRDALAGLIRQLASQAIAIRRGASPHTAKDIRDKLKRANVALRELATAFDQLPDIARGLMADWQPAENGAPYDNWVRNLAGLLSAPRKATEIAARVEKMTQAVKVSRGRARENELLWAIKELCGIYEIVTGRLPGRDYNHYSGRDGGPFNEFVAAAITPLWPNRGRVGRHVRVAVRWYKRRRSAG